MDTTTVAFFQAYVTHCYETDAPPFLFYHNLAHTKDVVMHCRELADYYHIGEKEKSNLLIAAWFHDVGHLYTTPHLHEEKSVDIMRSQVVGKLDPEDIILIAQLILATKLSAQPASLLEYIIRDADTFHFGTKEFFATDALVRKEMELRTGMLFPFWNQHSIELLKSHRFYTSYCQTHLNAGKEENIAVLEAQF